MDRTLMVDPADMINIGFIMICNNNENWRVVLSQIRSYMKDYSKQENMEYI